MPTKFTLTNLLQVGTRILYPTDYLPTQNVAQTRLIESFIENLESLLGIKRTEISLADMWRESKPDLVEETDLAEYLKTVFPPLPSEHRIRMLMPPYLGWDLALLQRRHPDCEGLF